MQECEIVINRKMGVNGHTYETGRKELKVSITNYKYEIVSKRTESVNAHKYEIVSRRKEGVS